MKAKIIAILIAAILLGCSSSKENTCKLDARYTFNFEQAQYYALPPIDFSFSLSYDYLVRMPEFGSRTLIITKWRVTTMTVREACYLKYTRSKGKAHLSQLQNSVPHK